MDDRVVRALLLGLAVTLIAAIVFGLWPSGDAPAKNRTPPAPETIALAPLPARDPAQSIATIESTKLWGVPPAAATAPKSVGRIVAAVRTRDERYLLVQFDQQQPVQFKIGEVLPENVGQYGGARIDDIQSGQVIVTREGKRIIMAVLN